MGMSERGTIDGYTETTLILLGDIKVLKNPKGLEDYQDGKIIYRKKRERTTANS